MDKQIRRDKINEDFATVTAYFAALKNPTEEEKRLYKEATKKHEKDLAAQQ